MYDKKLYTKVQIAFQTKSHRGWNENIPHNGVVFLATSCRSCRPMGFISTDHGLLQETAKGEYERDAEEEGIYKLFSRDLIRPT